MQTLKNQIIFFTKILFSSFSEIAPTGGSQAPETNKDSMEGLSPEKQETMKKLEGARATEQITGKASKHLETQLKKIPNVGDDPDARQTIDFFTSMRKKEQIAKVEISKYEKDLGITPEVVAIQDESNDIQNKSPEISSEKLKTITNREFLELPEEERLQYITKDNVDYEDVAGGDVKEITFNFDNDGNGKDDSDLYMYTTAGQVLGKEVGEVESGGVTYSRTGVDGEFFNGNERLVIHTGTDVKIDETRKPEDIAILEAGVSEKLKTFEGNPSIDIAKEALERGIDPEFAIISFSDSVDGFNDGSRKTRIEELFTQYDRLRDGMSNSNIDTLENGKIPEELALMVLRQFNNNWEEKANLYGIDNTRIKEVVSNLSEGFKSFDINELPEGVNGLLDFISKAEGTNGNYNAIYGNGEQSAEKFTEMTLREVLSYQKEYKKGKGSAAIGKYQFMDYTLEYLMTKHMISPDTKFTPELQDKLALFQLKARGLDSYMSGSISKDQFQHKLSKEWASLPKDASNRSYYAGDGLNHALVSNKDIDGVLERLKDTA